MTKKKKKTVLPPESPAPPTTAAPGVYHPTVFKCVRCKQPVKVHATPTFSRILAIQCTQCSCRIDVEEIRTVTKKTVIIEPPDEEPLDPED